MAGLGRPLSKASSSHMIPFRVVVAVTPRRGAGGRQVRRVAVDQLTASERERCQELVGAVVDLLNRVVAREPLPRPRITVDTDVVLRRRLALHESPPEVGFDIGVVRGHQRMIG